MATPMDTSDATTDLQISAQPAAPEVDGLMKWHLYIGFSWEDREMVKKLLPLMHYKDLKFSLRSSLDVKEEAQADNIKQGIVFSHKCLLYISPDYLKDPNSQQELKEAERKLKFLGNSSVLGIVQPNVKTEQLGEYEKFRRISLSDDQTMQECLSNSDEWKDFVKDYELKPYLQLGPKENIGVGVAYTYFFGFLQIVIPGVWKKFKEEMANNDIIKDDKDDNLVKKMLIIIRKSVDSPPRLNEPGVEQTKFCIKQVFHRAGKERREYTLYVYKLAANDEYKNDFYFIADFPACLFALREAFDYELNTTMMRKDEVFEARNEFVLTVKALLSHQDNQAKFGNQWELLLWPDDKEDHRVELSEFLHRQIESKQLTTELPRGVIRPPVNTVHGRVNFIRGRGIRDFPMYAEGEHYDLKDSNRGYCVIISNYCFRDPHLKKRFGGDAEIKKLEELFKALKFEVVVERNLDVQEMRSIMEVYRGKDHSKSDAFVCCLLSHGSKGRIFGYYGKEISVVELMEPFYEENCPGLKGKPKLFFIGPCQSLGVNEVQTSLGHVPEAGPDAKPDPDAIPDPDAKPDPSDKPDPEAKLDPNAKPDPNTIPDPEAKPDPNSEIHSTKFMRDMIPPTVDFIVSYATLPYKAAFRDTKKGGYYVQALCKYLDQDLEIDVALRRVNQEVRKYWKTIGEKQDPFHIIMPPQRFLFLKPL